MKTAIRKSLVLVALLVAVTVSYGNEISGNTNDGKSVRTNVTFKNVKSGSILSIKDINGLVLYKEAIKESGNYSKGFDLTTLPNGDYYFEMNKEIIINVIPFSVKASIVIFDKTAEKKYFKPRVNVIGQMVYISKSSFNSNEEIEVRIYSEKDDLAYAGKITEKKGNTLANIYDFSTSEKGMYSIVIITNGRRFVENIQI